MRLLFLCGFLSVWAPAFECNVQGIDFHRELLGLESGLASLSGPPGYYFFRCVCCYPLLSPPSGPPVTQEGIGNCSTDFLVLDSVFLFGWLLLTNQSLRALVLFPSFQTAIQPLPYLPFPVFCFFPRFSAEILHVFHLFLYLL